MGKQTVAGRVILSVGLLVLLHAAYSAEEHHKLAKLVEDEDERLPFDIILQTFIAFLVCCYGAVNSFGSFQNISAASEWNSKTWDSISNRASFNTFNHRGRLLFKRN
eukprot:Colp12_sorted_trinity150504_noHs@13422